MEKFIRICSIVAAGLVLLSLLALLIMFPLQRPLARLFDYPQEMLGVLPIFPFVPVILCVLRLILIAPMVITNGEKGSIVLDVILFLGMMILIPLANMVLTSIPPVILGRMGSAYISAYSISNIFAGYCTVFVGCAQAIAYAVCGMRIVSKWMNRNAERKLVQ